jgi:hypothetical protein
MRSSRNQVSQVLVVSPSMVLSCSYDANPSLPLTDIDLISVSWKEAFHRLLVAQASMLPYIFS